MILRLTFTPDGLLPPGDYEMTLDELRSSLLVAGPEASSPHWDAVWRRQLVDNLEVLVKQLWQVGITEIYADGSFAEEKDHPGDIDGSFVCDEFYYRSGRLERELNALDPHQVWTWAPNRLRPYRGKDQLPMWHQYRVELWPHYPGRRSGIRDQYGHFLTFPAAFRKTRYSHQPRGIIKIGGAS